MQAWELQPLMTVREGVQQAPRMVSLSCAHRGEQSATRRARTGPDSCSSLHHPAWHGLVTGKVEFDWLNERMIANTLYSTYYVQVTSTYVQVTYYV